MLASLSADLLKRVILSIQNAGGLYEFFSGLQPLSAFTVMDKLGKDDQGVDNSQFYKDLWSREEKSQELVEKLMRLKKTAMECVAKEMLASFFD